MKKYIYIFAVLIAQFFGLMDVAQATHSMGLDLTYKQLGVNTFEVTVSFYRDCAGIAAPNDATIDVGSITCGENLQFTLPLISSRELDAVCASLGTTCNGGPYPGMEEYIYRGIIVLPQQCVDWNFSYRLCCRNNAINTIVDPGNSRIFVETLVDNTLGIINSSPVFTNPPVPFMCVGASYCFNNGAVDPDGDSLVYSLVTPTTNLGSADTVEYLAGFDPYNPVTSFPLMTFDKATGDFCMTPTVLGEVSVMQVLIEEYRNGVLIGAIDRDIQLRVVDCSGNNLPYTDGINGTGIFLDTVCVDENYSFVTNAIDADAGNNVTMTWNSGIPNSSFTINETPRPDATFVWTPGAGDVSNSPHCFTVNVTDDNCPFIGSQVFSYCILVEGARAEVGATTNIDCFGNCTGTATVTPLAGILPYTYQWDDPSNQTSATANNLCAGSYNVTMTDGFGCSVILDTALTEPSILNLNVNNITNVNCRNGNDGSAQASATGGTVPYTFVWSNGFNGFNPTNFVAGNHTVTVTDAQGCQKTTTINITEPPTSLAVSDNISDVTCRFGSDGSITLTPSGGTPNYTYQWDANAGNATTPAVTGLQAGTYGYVVTDNNSCTVASNATINQPVVAVIINTATSPVDCYGASTGTATVVMTGGTAPYTYLWEGIAGGGTNSLASNLPAGTFHITSTDGNNCVMVTPVTVTQPPTIFITAVNVNATCGLSNGSITATGNGGNGGAYTYLWGNGAITPLINGIGLGVYPLTVTDNNGCALDTFAVLSNILPLTTITAQTNLSCYGTNIGSATVAVGGGLPPYQYIWTNGQITPSATGLTGGLVYVTVSDGNGCKAIEAVDILSPSIYELNVDTTPVSCFGTSTGSVIATVIGGTSPYNYLWGNNAGNETTSSVANLPIGNYAVTITDDNACQLFGTTTITEPNELNITATNTSVSCHLYADGTLTIVANGGTNPYSYQWDAFAGSSTSNTVTGMLANGYNVVVTDANNCTKNANTIISRPPAIITDTIVDGVSCKTGNDGAVTVTPSGGVSNYTYFWSTGEFTPAIANLITGTYTVTITDGNGCVTTTTAFVQEPAQAISVTFAITGTDCNGTADGIASAEVVGGISPYTYVWNNVANNQTTQIATGLLAGTYTVVVTDANNCTTNPITATVTEPLILSSTDVMTEPSCIGFSDGTTRILPLGGTVPYQYLWDVNTNNQTTQTASGLPTGNYSVTITDANNCELISATTITEPTELLITATNTTVSCFGFSDGQVSVLGSGATPPYTYLWDNNANNQTTIAVQGLPLGNYVVTVTDDNGCTKITNTTVIEPTILDSDTLVTDVSCKFGSDGVVTAIPIGGMSPYTYLWEDASVLDSIDNLTTGNYAVTISDVNNCTITTTAFVDEPAFPLSATLSFTDVSCKLGFNGTATAIPQGGTAPYSYNWNNLAGNQTSQTASGLFAGTFNVVVTDAKGCAIGPLFVTVSEPDELQVQDSIVNVSCNGGNNGQAFILPIGGTIPFTYIWDNGSPLSGAIGLIAGVYNVTVTDNNNCVTVHHSTVTEPEPLAFSDSTVAPTCFGDADGQAFAQVSGGLTPYFYQWNNGAGTSTATGLIAGNYFVIVTDSNNCVLNGFVTLSQPDELVANASGLNVLCKLSTDGVATASANGGTDPYNYQWDMNTGFQNGTSASALPPGDYDITVTDAHQCVVVETATIGSPSSISLTTTPIADTICPGSSSLIGALATGGIGGYTFDWDNGLGQGQSHVVSPSETTTYQVTVSDGNNCDAVPASVTVYVMNLIFDSLYLSSAGNICPDSSTTITANFYEEYPPYTYTWDGINENSLGTFTVSPTQPTYYYLTITDQCNNQIVDSILVDIFDVPQPSFEPVFFEGCIPLSVNFSNTGITDSISQYIWTFGDGTNSDQQNPNHAYETSGAYDVTLMIISNDGCIAIATDTGSVLVYPLPDADCLANPKITTTQFPTISFLDISSGAVDWYWEFGDGDTSSLQSPTHTYQDTGIYPIRLVITNQFGCVDEKLDYIIVNPFYDIEAPTAFTPSPNGPNGGGHGKYAIDNNVFFPLTDYVDDFHLMIFNRWGELIFESFDKNIGWDGYYRDVLCQQDVYVWKVEVTYTTGEVAKKVGQVTLIR